VNDYGDSVYVGVQDFLQKNGDLLAKQVQFLGPIYSRYFCTQTAILRCDIALKIKFLATGFDDQPR